MYILVKVCIPIRTEYCATKYISSMKGFAKSVVQKSGNKAIKIRKMYFNI